MVSFNYSFPLILEPSALTWAMSVPWPTVTHSGQPLLTPRAFGVVDEIFCIFEGILDNVVMSRQRYGLNKSADEMAIIIEAYWTLRDRGPYHADEVLRDLLGKFAFVLFDSTSEALFTAADADDSVPFFWGTAADDYLVLSDEPNVLKEGCGKSFAPFPRGCYLSTSDKFLQSSKAKAVGQLPWHLP